MTDPIQSTNSQSISSTASQPSEQSGRKNFDPGRADKHGSANPPRQAQSPSSSIFAEAMKMNSDKVPNSADGFPGGRNGGTDGDPVSGDPAENLDSQSERIRDHAAEMLAAEAAQIEQNHLVKLAEVVAQGERARADSVEQFGTDMMADSLRHLEELHKALSKAASA